MIQFYTTESDEIRNICKTITNHTGVSLGMMQDKTRKRHVVEARFMAIYFIKLNNEKMTLNRIGYLFGNRDHATIINAIQRFDDYFDTEKKFREKMINICNEIDPYLITRLGQLSKYDLRSSNGLHFKKVDNSL